MLSSVCSAPVICAPIGRHRLACGGLVARTKFPFTLPDWSRLGWNHTPTGFQRPSIFPVTQPSDERLLLKLQRPILRFLLTQQPKRKRAPIRGFETLKLFAPSHGLRIDVADTVTTRVLTIMLAEVSLVIASRGFSMARQTSSRRQVPDKQPSPPERRSIAFVPL